MKQKLNTEWKSLTELLPENEFNVNIKFNKNVTKPQRDAIIEKIKQNIQSYKIESYSGTILRIESVIFDEKGKLICIHGINDKHGFETKISGACVNDKIFKLIKI